MTPPALVGNVFTAHGSLDIGVMAGSRPVLYAPPTWDLLNDLALAATFVAFALLGALLVAERRRLSHTVDVRSIPMPLGSVAGMLAVFVVLFSAGTIALGSTSILFDRYVWPLALPLAILLLRPPEPSPSTDGAGSRQGPVASMAGSRPAAYCERTRRGHGDDESGPAPGRAAFAGARWRMGEEAVRLGFAPETVDAGLEWVGFHATGLAE